MSRRKSFGASPNKEEKIALLRRIATEMEFDRITKDGEKSFVGRKSKAYVVYKHGDVEYLLTKNEALDLTPFGLRVPNAEPQKEKKNTKRLKDIL